VSLRSSERFLRGPQGLVKLYVGPCASPLGPPSPGAASAACLEIVSPLRNASAQEQPLTPSPSASKPSTAMCPQYRKSDCGGGGDSTARRPASTSIWHMALAIAYAASRTTHGHSGTWQTFPETTSGFSSCERL
jgi:hypothetical protein